MALVQQAIDRSTPPADSALESCIDDREYSADRGQAQRVEVPAFDQRDR